MKERVILGIFSVVWLDFIFISAYFVPNIMEIVFFGGAVICGAIFVHLLDLKL